MGSSPLHRCGCGDAAAFRPSVDDREDDLAAAAADSLFAAASLVLSLKNPPKTGREQTGTLSTTGATRTPDE